jgi:hypothetical protein
VLQDPEERETYDWVLASRRTAVVISDEIDLEEMEEEEAEEEDGEEAGAGAGAKAGYSKDGPATERTRRYTHRCRCGDCYEVLSSELHPDFDDVDVPCASCSLYVRVRYGEQLGGH